MSQTSPWNLYVKDALERKLHKLVCAGQLDLKTAQRKIASDWIEAYEKYVAKSSPAPRVREAKACSRNIYGQRGIGKHAYWKPRSRFYGKTKEGEFMSELEALDRGYSPAGGTGQ